MTHKFIDRSKKVKQLAKSHGFMSCGISRSGFLKEEEKNLSVWLQKGFHGKMHWMENHFDKRLDTTKLVPSSKSVISLTYNYFPEEDLSNAQLKLSKYAYGKDYHFVIKDKLKDLLNDIQREYGVVEGRVFVDSAPVLERAWAAKAGIGWIGKHSLLLSKKQGSFYFLAEMILDLELEPDGPTTDHCGSCTACIDACPTDAIISDKVVDSTKCISYLTIELKDEIPASFKGDMDGWIFGCDICQDVCPWNRFSKPHQEEQFKAHPKLKDLHRSEWKELTEEVFKDVFKKSAVKRAGFTKLQESIKFSGNTTS